MAADCEIYVHKSVVLVTDNEPMCHIKGAKQVSPAKEWRWTVGLSAAANEQHNPLLWLDTSLVLWKKCKACWNRMIQRIGKQFSGETCCHSCQTFRRHPPVRLTWRCYGAEKVQRPLLITGCDSWHHWPLPLLHWDLCTFELLGLFCVLRTFADLPQPNLLDILVPGEPHCDWGGAQLDQTRHTVTIVWVQLDWIGAGRATGLLQPSNMMRRRGLAGHTEAEASSKIMNLWTCGSPWGFASVKDMW